MMQMRDLQQALRDAIPAAAHLGAAGKIAQIAQHAAISNHALLARLIAVVGSVGAHEFEDAAQDLVGQLLGAVAPTVERRRVVVRSIDVGLSMAMVLALVLEVAPRAEVLQETHGAAGEAGRAGSASDARGQYICDPRCGRARQ